MTTTLDFSTLRIGFGDCDLTGSVLRDAILSFFRKESDKQTNNDFEKKNNIIQISNRYFDAKVALEEIMESSDPTQKEDGILLAFMDDSGINPVPFDTLTMIHQKADESGQCGDLLRLCIGITFVNIDTLRRNTQSKKYEEEYSRRVLWCLDRGYEYVEADLSEEGQISGHDLREKDGFARIIEAINGTVWSSSIRKTTTTQSVKTQHLILEKASNKEETTEKPKLQSNTIAGQGQLPDTPSNQIVETGEKVEEMSKTIPTTESNNKVETDTSDETKRDILMDEFEQVMKEASRIRNASKSGQLSDEERRQRAGDAASTLMGLLDRMGFDDDDDQGEYMDSSDEEIVKIKK